MHLDDSRLGKVTRRLKDRTASEGQPDCSLLDPNRRLVVGN